MNLESCIRLETMLRERAAALGVPTLGDESVFDHDRRSDDGVLSLLAPRERLLARIDALERHILLLHRGVYEASMEKIRALITRDDFTATSRDLIPTGAVAILQSPTLEGQVEFDLGNLPDLSKPLERLQQLRSRILEDDDART